MGGMIAICVTAQISHLVRGGIYSAPALMIDPALMKLRSIVTFIQSFMTKLVVSKLTGDSLCHDPVVIQQYENDILNTPGIKKPVPARTALQLIVGIERAHKSANDFKIPYVLVQGGDDSVCLPEGAKYIL